MTLNYVVTEDAPILEGDEMFLPITIEKAYALGLEERPQPKPQPVLVQQPTTTTPPSPSTPVPTVTSTPAPPTTTTPPAAIVETAPVVVSDTGPYANQVVATWWDGSTQVSNGFYK